MASQRDQTSTNHIEIPVYGNVTDQPRQSPIPEGDEDDTFDYSQRTQWLRAAVLGANDGLVSVASLMMGVGAVKQDVKTMLIAGFAGLVAGACSMAIGEFVSVYTQYDIEISQMKREMKTNGRTENVEEAKKKMLPNPAHAALASAIAFSIGAVVPLLGAAFISEHKMRLAVVAALVSVALVVFGGVGARLGGSSVVKSCARVLVGGWMAMTITFALTKLIGSSGGCGTRLGHVLRSNPTRRKREKQLEDCMLRGATGGGRSGGCWVIGEKFLGFRVEALVVTKLSLVVNKFPFSVGVPETVQNDWRISLS
ncbi:hypothetical protein C1H46_028228 [Malus baccata]|uniref:Uncharacterized protein n=1 Tax=Malus baccata TaxID=106549 RepID=A0A540LIB8_MALBA|nr:hypothetical protein C1H46_028228 [Malus baccata]